MNTLKLDEACGRSGKTVLSGCALTRVIPQKSAPPEKCGGDALIRTHSGNIAMTDEMLSRGTLFLGSTGSGKTNTVMMLLDSILSHLTSDDAVIIFDSKRDFIERFYAPERYECVVVSSEKADCGTARSWNLFEECCGVGARRGGKVTIDDDVLFRAKELSRALMKNLESAEQPFFHIAAADVFKMTVLSFIANAAVTGDASSLTNSALADFLDSASAAELFEMARGKFGYIRSYLGNPSSPTPQSLGVEGFLHAMCSDTFTGPFRSNCPSGDFSMRGIVRDKGGRVVFIEYDVSRGASLAPVYSFLFDSAIKEQLSCGTGRTYLFCDELSLLPHCEHLSDALNIGRSRGLRTVSSLQSVNQLYSAYGEAQGRAILAGFVNCFAFYSDADTREFVSRRFGKTFEVIKYAGENITREGFAADDETMMSLIPGEAAADLFGYPKMRFRAEKFV